MGHADEFRLRVDRHAALGDPSRLAIVDHLVLSDRSPQELQRLIDIPSNLLAHHLEVLEAVGLIERSRSSGDGRRRYAHLLLEPFRVLGPRGRLAPQPVLFVCTANSARSQLAAALWVSMTGERAASAGTAPAEHVHRGAIAAAKRAGLDIADAHPTPLAAIRRRPALTITVCDRAHEKLDNDPHSLHWSISDPVPDGSPAAFDATVAELRERIEIVVGAA